MHLGSMLVEIAGGNNSGLKRKAQKMGSQRNTSDIATSLLISLSQNTFRGKMLMPQEFLVRNHSQQDVISYLLPEKNAFILHSHRETMAMPVVATRSPKLPLLVPGAANNQDGTKRSVPQNHRKAAEKKCKVR